MDKKEKMMLPPYNKHFQLGLKLIEVGLGLLRYPIPPYYTKEPSEEPTPQPNRNPQDI
jgi:hypothetical protein